MEYWEVIRKCINETFKFSGRTCKSEYFSYVSFLLISLYCLNILINIVYFGEVYKFLLNVMYVVIALLLFIPFIALQCRRLHDQNQSGWWVLLNLFPVLGTILLILLSVQSGTVGPNRFGDDPLAANGASDEQSPHQQV